MDTKVWLGVSGVRFPTYSFLVLRGHKVHRLVVDGSGFSGKKILDRDREALENGADPREIKSSSLETFDVRQIFKAIVSHNDRAFVLYGEGQIKPALGFSTNRGGAGEVLQTILAASGRIYQPSEQQLGAAEILQPLFFQGLFAFFFWRMLYGAAQKVAGGGNVGLQKPGARRGPFEGLAGALGPGGGMVLGGVLIALMLVWATRRLMMVRPKRVIWVAEPSLTTIEIRRDGAGRSRGWS